MAHVYAKKTNVHSAANKFSGYKFSGYEVVREVVWVSNYNELCV